MSGLVLPSMRSRMRSFVACFVSVLLGAVLIGSFGSLLETAVRGDVSGADAETLTVLGSVVGGWATVIVLFSVASTITLTLRQREAEVALLRTVGATPRQVRRLVTGETLLLAASAVAVALVPMWLLGRLIFSMLQDAGMISATAEHTVGIATFGCAAGAMLVVSWLAAFFAARRFSRGARVRRAGLGRAVLGVLVAGVGLTYSLLTVTVNRDSADPYAAMSTAGPACVFLSIGLAILAPLLLSAASATAGRLLRFAGAPGHLAGYDASQRAHVLAGILVPVIIFVGMSTGTVYLMAIENDATPAAIRNSVEGQSIYLLNNVVIAMIALFAAIMVLNTTAAVVSARRSELGLQRLAGATPGQVVTTFLLEGVLVCATGIVLGGLASLSTVVPYSEVKLDALLPGLGVWYFPAIAALATVVTLGSGYVATRSALRTPAVEAAGLGAPV